MVSILLLFLPIFNIDDIHAWLTPTEHDFGRIERAEPVTYEFRFQNTSEDPIFVDNVRTTCGCTAPDWDPDGVEPDSTGVIRIVYDAKKPGYFRKRILVFFNHQRAAERLYIEGEVVE